MTTLAKYYGMKQLYSTDLGIEIEAEFKDGLPNGVGNPVPIDAATQWIPHNDGSLRRGVEFTTSKPIGVADTRRAVKTLFDKWPNFTFSQRTSVHFHFNVQHRTFLEIYTAILGFWVFEDCIISVCDPKRHGNLFCLPWTLAEGQVVNFVNDFKKKSYFYTFSPDHYKYSAFNLACLRNLGTLEFRALEGTYDIDKIVAISSGIHTLINGLANQYASPAHMFDDFFTKLDTPEQLLDRWVPEPLRGMIKDKCPDYKNSIRDSMTQISYAAYLDWERDTADIPPRKKSAYELAIERERADIDRLVGMPAAPFLGAGGGGLRMNAVVVDDEED